MDIRILGPRGRNQAAPQLVNTTSHAEADWQRDLSPFFLGPVPLYNGRVARRMENAWQFAKVYPKMLDANGRVTTDYWF